MDRVAAAFDSRQKENRLLDVWGKHQQVHDLGDAGAGDVGQPSEFGVVGHIAGSDQLVEADRQRHEAGYAGHAAR